MPLARQRGGLRLTDDWDRAAVGEGNAPRDNDGL